MKYSKPIIIAIVLLAGGLVSAAIIHPSWSKVKADAQSYNESFTAALTSEQEMMASSTNTSHASGTAIFNVSSDNSMINYVVNVSNLTSPFSAAHLHCAPAGNTGQVIVPLMMASSTTSSTSDVTLSGSILENDILPAAMSCNPNIKTLSHLIQAMREGQIYVNVHTQNYPMGEVRGQLMKSNQVIDFTATSTIATTSQMTASTTVATSTSATTSDMNSDTTSSSTTSSDTSSTVSSTTTSTSPAGWDYVFVKPDAYYKIQGSSIQFSGSHFKPNEQVTITSQDSSIGTTQANASGNFETAPITIPYGVGQRIYTFRGLQSQLSFPVYVDVGSGSPWIGLSTYYAPVGSSVTISGHQFGGNEDVTLSWGGSSFGTAHTDSQGNFSFTTTIPTNSPQQTTVTATGVNTHMSTSQPFSRQ